MTINDFLRLHGVATAPEGHHHRTRGFPLQTDCPWCSPNSRKWRLGVKRSHCSCWTCGYRPLVASLALLTGLPRREVEGVLDDVPADRPQDAAKRGHLVVPDGVGDLLPCHRSYLEGRGFDPDELVRLWGIGGIGMASRLAWRVFVPFHLDGEVVSWMTRGITDTQRHWSASPEEEAVDHKTLLYGEDHCGHAVVVVEGMTDVWAVGPGAVGLSGTGYKREQVLRLAKFPVRAVCLNNEVDAQRVARKLCRDLAAFPGDTHNVVLTHKDAAETMLRKPGELDYIRREFLGRGR